MNQISVVVPRSFVVEKVIKGSKGEFTIYGLQFGSKFMRFTYPAGRMLPDDAPIECHMYSRKYNARGAVYDEVALWVDNHVERVINEQLELDLEADEKKLPF